MIISSVCVEWVFFGALAASNNDANHFWHGFEKRTKTQQNSAAWQFELYELNSSL